jgi:hypothetical protein
MRENAAESEEQARLAAEELDIQRRRLEELGAVSEGAAEES